MNTVDVVKQVELILRKIGLLKPSHVFSCYKDKNKNSTRLKFYIGPVYMQHSAEWKPTNRPEDCLLELRPNADQVLADFIQTMDVELKLIFGNDLIKHGPWKEQTYVVHLK
jgi:hypothetical protein